MKSIFLKFKIKIFLLLLLISNSFYAQEITNSTNQRSISTANNISNKKGVSLAPSVTITGNFSICLPGPTTTQLIGSGIPNPITPWISSNPAVATVDNTGLVTSVSFGATTITYFDNLGNGISENVYVSTFPTINTPFGTSTCAGGNLQLDGSLFPNATTPWTSLTPAIATIDNTGLLTGVTGGIATIEYKNLGGCTTTAPITINPLLVPTVTCGATTLNQITFNWSSVAGAGTYVRSYQINSGGFLSAGSGPPLTYTLTGLLPNTIVDFYVAPSGAVGLCFQVGTVQCQTPPCTAASTPLVPTIGLITPPTCALATGSVTLSGLPAGNWTLNQAGTVVNTIAGNTASTIISGLIAGNYTFTVANSFGCVSVATANINIPAQPVTPAAPIIGVITPPTCALATGSVDISGLPAGNWTLNQAGAVVNSIAGNTLVTTVSGLIAGSYTFSVTNSVGCTSLVSVNVPIPVQPITPAAPTIGIITPPTCVLATGSVDISGLPAGNWTLNQAGTVANSIAGNTLVTTISGLIAGSYTFTVTNSVGCTSLVSVNVPIPIQPITPAAPTIGIITPPTCVLATGSVDISGLPAGNWTLNQAGAVVNSIAGNTLVTTVSGLIAGSYTFTVTNSVGCTSLVSVNVPIPVQPITPAAPTIGIITPPTCALATGSVDISGLPAGNWTLNQAGAVVNSIAGNTLVTTVAGLIVGSYTFTVTNSVGCTSLVSVNVPIPIQPITPAAPIIGIITPPTCALATGSVDISGLPAGNWTLNQAGAVVNSIAGNTLVTTVAGLIAGSYTFTVTNSVGCTSLVSVNVPIPSQPVTPAAPIIGIITPPNCITVTGSVAISGLPAGNWTLDQSGTVLNSILGNTISTLISGLIGGNYTFTVTNSVGCTSLASLNVNIPLQPVLPNAPISSGDIIQCEVFPLQTLNANSAVTPLLGETITWYDALVLGSVVLNPTLNSIGSITYYAQSNDGTCDSATRTAVTLTINPAPAAPISTGDITQCEQLPIQTLDAINAITPVFGQTITWYTLATGGTLVVTPTLNTFGTVTYFGETNDGTCNSLTRTSVKLTITGAPAAPISTGDITQCEQLPIQTLDAINAITPVFGQTVTWYTLATGGTLVATPTLNTVGTITYYAQVNDGTCNSLTRTAVTLTITGAPAAPISTGDIIECEKATLQTLNANAAITVLPGQTITWFDAISNGNIVLLPTLNTIGSITYYAETKVGNCLSLTRTAVLLKINPAPAPPISGGDQFECELTPIQTITASASVPLGQIITWFDAPTAGNTVFIPSLNSAISIIYFAESSDGICSSLSRTPVILTINQLPANPVVGLLTQPDCFTATGSITIFPVPAGVSYSFDNGPYTNTTFYDLLPAGTIHTIRAKNSGGCLSQLATTVTILPQPATPITPILNPIQPTCTIATGGVLISSIPGVTYSFDGGPFINTLNYTGLIAGSTHTVKAKNAAGCISPTASITLNIQPLTPAAPALIPIQPTCTVATGAVQISNVLGETYSFDGSPFSPTLNYFGLTSGSSHIVTAQNGSGCISLPSTITLNIQPPTPLTPSFVATQPNCTNALGEITILNVAGETYSFDGNPYNNTQLIYSNIEPGTYTITAQNGFGCISSVALVTIDPQPITLTPAILDGVICIDQATGIPFQTHILNTGLNLATHSFVWKLDNVLLPYTGSSIEATQPGVYTVVATNIATGCDSQVATAIVTASFPGLGISTQVFNQFSNDAGVIVTVSTGTGPYLYQLDNGPYQQNNVFSSVPPGTHTIHVKDEYGCTYLTTEVTVLGYMNFFTPNDDTYNDTWKVIGLESQPNAIIHIFDRYGKYIKQISANGSGWDGTLNNQPLPSTDYWFTVDYTENGQSKEFKSHFSLVR